MARLKTPDPARPIDRLRIRHVEQGVALLNVQARINLAAALSRLAQ